MGQGLEFAEKKMKKSAFDWARVGNALGGIGGNAIARDATAAANAFESGLGGMIPKAVGGAMTAGIVALSTYAIKALVDKIRNNPKRTAMLEDLMKHDPIISKANRDEVIKYYATIFNVAPTLSLDTNTVKELLQNFIKFGRIDIQTLKTLADTEQAMSKRDMQSVFKLKDFLV